MPLNKTQQKEFARRRRQLMRAMGEGGIAIIPAAPTRSRNHDVEYPYRQDSDFWYLTGFIEPESVAVLVPGREQGEFILFCRERDPTMETWNGRRAGQDGAVKGFGADDSFPIGDMEEILPGLLENRERVYTSLGRDPDFDRKLIGWVNHIREKVRSGARPPHEFVALEYLLHDMRLFKSAFELKAMRQAARITSEAHVQAMRACRPGAWEYQVEAELLYAFRRAGTEPAYPSIVGGGENGCILHYTENEAQLKEGDLLLIDAGCEYQGYASDITRTFPVSGRFSGPQREVYELVLEAQKAAIAQVVPGNHWDDPHMAAVKVLTKGLVSLGLLKGKPARLIKDEAYRPFYMHRTGHWLGMDVHDVGDYKLGDAWRLLEPGMVMTIEPGLYLSRALKGVPKAYRDIGIRIEDDVVVTREGHEVLTAECPKEPDELESLVGTQP
ncbi:Xaa-Pro aminopeptidase [Ectothiorhodospira variabilis]|uniref:Xaa-Pro aminopeptidase n=1 Tax=Ectothiorhodospira variabilis TaxID=505694 RepID=UPI001EFB1E57|nr:Xaa-Pro aminopeptidase [Ectothiorhodospira variabilis]MCG5494447.1 Xaa-Pro aminopeptidase [Ectothiorhodospira variabilis]MCG5498906.1 Xaa-Pro aminopeptidase [Ectothiorhodospira variabilis]MCG5503182.1 Xaa-Pro aminopeptidase [Ectothiorhodospira variabilis]MCG5506059.1 Xaa-Pro aminopeptidase [Ectothiorhodospira variabilis]